MPRMLTQKQFATRVAAATTALVAALAVTVVGLSDAQACSPGPAPVEDCELDVDKQQFPGCLNATHEVEQTSNACRFVAQFDNQCDRDAQLTVFCDAPDYRECPEDRVVPAGEVEEVDLTGPDQDYIPTFGPYSGLALQVELVETDDGDDSTDNDDPDDTHDEDDETADEDEQGDDELDERQSGVDYQFSAETGPTPTPACPMHSSGPFGCSAASSSNTPVPVPVIVALVLVAATTILRRDDEPATS